MPRNESGVFTLVPGYEAILGETIQPSQHNPPLEDIASALTASLPRNGSAPMGAPLKLSDGSAAAPSLTFNTAGTVGIFKLPNGIGFSVGGVQVLAITATGLIGLPLGTPIPVLDDTLPDLCVWADGRNISRTTYAALFAKWGTKYGAGDGTTTFGMPDLRGRVLGGRDNLGGTDSGRLANVPVVSGSRTTTGGIVGESFHVTSVAEMPAHNHSGSITGPAGAHSHIYLQNPNTSVQGGAGAGVGSTQTNGNTDAAPDHTHALAITEQGQNAPHNNVQQTFVCNYAIFAGA